MRTKIKCPGCQAETTMSLIESRYEGSFRCWKCHALFTVELKNNDLTFCEPLSEEEFQKQQETKAIQDKLKRQFPGREESN